MNIYVGSYFPWFFKIILILLVMARLSNFSPSSIEIAFLFVLTFIVFTAHYGIRISTDRKVYSEYLSLLGLRIGKRKSYETIECLSLEPNYDIAAYNADVKYSTKIDDEYYGYIRCSPNQKIQIIKSKDRQAVVNKLVAISKKLNLKIMDFTREVPDEL